MNLYDVYPLLDVEPVKASGLFLWDKKNEKYMDMYGGHAVISIGHNHPLYIEKITAQLNKISFYSNSVVNCLQIELANKLTAMSGYDNFKLFLCNSGAEANENALKVASFYNGRKKVIAFKSSFHGRTSAALSVTDDLSISSPLNEREHTIFLPLNDIEALNSALYEHKVCAVIIEGVQGVGGINVPSKAFLKRIRAVCDYTGALFIIDEVQSGYGRTGKFFAHQHAGVRPDIITVAKGMGNGFPLAATLIHPAIPAKYGMLGSTFGGNHLACAAGLAVLEVIEKENLIENAKQMGEYLSQKLMESDGVQEVRGIGLMLGIKLDIPATEIRNELFKTHKIFTGTSSDKNIIRILPPLNITEKEADLFMNAFNSVMEKQLVLNETF